jgi:hypothetical protein
VTNASILTVEKQICRLIIRLKVKWGATIVAQRMRIQLCASFSITKMVKGTRRTNDNLISEEE